MEVMRPGLIWACSTQGDRTHVAEDFDSVSPHGFRWLHLNLSDQGSHRWIHAESALPGAIKELLISQEPHPRMLIEHGVVGLVLEDFERDFEPAGATGIGALHVAIGEFLVVTGRLHPLRSADVVRGRLTKANVADGASALALLLDSMSGLFATTARDLAIEVQTAEDEFLNGNAAAMGRVLVHLRRRAARLHRLVGGMRGTLHRLENDVDTPTEIQAVAERFAQRVDAIDGDIAAGQGHLRVLRDDIDLQTAQRTNETLYFLSVMSALLLPATLVTGFFGMNTGGLPFVHGWAGSAAAGLIAMLASGTAWMLLRRR